MTSRLLGTLAVVSFSFVAGVLSWVHGNNKRMDREEAEWAAEHARKIRATRRPAGMDFHLWEQELEIKDWPEEKAQ